MICLFRKKYVIVLQIDSTKDAEFISAMEGYGNVNVNKYTEDLYRNNKVQMTIPTRRTYIGAILRALQYSKMGIMHVIVKA